MGDYVEDVPLFITIAYYAIAVVVRPNCNEQQFYYTCNVCMCSFLSYPFFLLMGLCIKVIRRNLRIRLYYECLRNHILLDLENEKPRTDIYFVLCIFFAISCFGVVFFQDSWVDVASLFPYYAPIISYLVKYAKEFLDLEGELITLAEFVEDNQKEASDFIRSALHLSEDLFEDSYVGLSILRRQAENLDLRIVDDNTAEGLYKERKAFDNGFLEKVLSGETGTPLEVDSEWYRLLVVDPDSMKTMTTHIGDILLMAARLKKDLNLRNKIRGQRTFRDRNWLEKFMLDSHLCSVDSRTNRFKWWFYAIVFLNTFVCVSCLCMSAYMIYFQLQSTFSTDLGGIADFLDSIQEIAG